MAKDCKNPTCDRDTMADRDKETYQGKNPTYCSDVCREAMRSVSNGKHLGDIWVNMSTWHRLVKMAEEDMGPNYSVRDYVRMLIEDEANLA